MSALFSTISVFFVCFTILGITLMVLLAMPKSKLRSYLLEVGKYGLTILLALLVVSPIDIVPDVIPALGWGDDLAYLIGAVASFKSARREREERKLLS